MKYRLLKIEKLKKDEPRKVAVLAEGTDESALIRIMHEEAVRDDDGLFEKNGENKKNAYNRRASRFYQGTFVEYLVVRASTDQTIAGVRSRDKMIPPDIRQTAARMAVGEMAQFYGVPVEKIRSWCKQVSCAPAYASWATQEKMSRTADEVEHALSICRTKREAAKFLGISPTTLAKLERNYGFDIQIKNGLYEKPSADSLRLLFEMDLSMKEIAKVYGVPEGAVHTWMRSEGLTRSSNDVPDDFKEVCAECDTWKEVMEHYNVSDAIVYRWRGKTRAVLRREDPKAPLFIPAEFVGMSNSGKYTCMELAEIFNVSVPTVCRWKKIARNY